MAVMVGGMAVVVVGGSGNADGFCEDNKGSSVESGSGSGVVVVVVEVVSKLLSTRKGIVDINHYLVFYYLQYSWLDVVS